MIIRTENKKKKNVQMSKSSLEDRQNVLNICFTPERESSFAVKFVGHYDYF